MTERQWVCPSDMTAVGDVTSSSSSSSRSQTLLDSRDARVYTITCSADVYKIKTALNTGRRPTDRQETRA